MEAIMVKQYKAKDGTVFENAEDCEAYEKDTMEIMKHAKILKNYCKNRTCEGCPFHVDDYSCTIDGAYNWDV